MRTLLAVSFLLASSMSALANSYTVGGGFFGYSPNSVPLGYWTPRMPGLNVGGGTPQQIPFTFNSANLSVSCSPICAVGDTFSMNLLMSGFVDQKYGGLWTGSLDLTTMPSKITSVNGVDIARFVLTGELSGCYYPVNCINITPDLHGYLKVNYSLVNGQMKISSMSYAIAEPSTMVLLGTGLLWVGFMRRGSLVR